MYPEAEACFNSDMKTLRHFAKIAQPAYVSMLGTYVGCVGVPFDPFSLFDPLSHTDTYNPSPNYE